MTMAELQFFDRMPQALPLYEAFAEKLRERYPAVGIKIQKTQISFSNTYGFAFVSLPVRRRKGWPEVCIIVTFGLGHRVVSPRIFQAVEPYPNRWTHHVIIQSAEEIDEELMGWVQAAYAFAQNK